MKSKTNKILHDYYAGQNILEMSPLLSRYVERLKEKIGTYLHASFDSRYKESANHTIKITMGRKNF